MDGVTRRVYLGRSTAAVAGVVAAACGESESSGPAGQPGSTAPKGRVIVMLPRGPREEQLYLPQWRAFEAKFPGLTVDWIWPDNLSGGIPDKLTVLIAGGTPPDVTGGGEFQVPMYAEKGWATNLSPFIKRDKVDMADFFENVQRVWIWKGNHYALGDQWGTQFLYVNRDLFRRAGLPIPKATDSYTYEQWYLESARKMTNATGDDSVWGSVTRTWLISIMDTVWSWGGDDLSADGKRVLLDSARATEAIQWTADHWLKHQVSPTPAFQSQPGQNHTRLFLAGRAGMILSTGLWEAGNYAEATGLDWQVIPLPKGPAGRANYLHSALKWLVRGGPNPEAGWKWLQFFTSAEGYRAQGGPPEDGPSTRKSLQEYVRQRAPDYWETRGVHAMHQVSVSTLRARRPNINTQQLQGAMNTALAPIWKGEKTARVAMLGAIGELNAIAGTDKVLL